VTLCWKTLLVDSYDGRFDHVYPIHCYHQAIAHMPLQLELYSNERNDILQALQRAIAGKSTGRPTVDHQIAASGGSIPLPIPLLALGSLAVLLILAGVAGAVWRRFRPAASHS
jgi:hypothetical protein